MKRFNYPDRYRLTVVSLLLAVLGLTSGFGWYVASSARQNWGSWARLALVMLLAATLWQLLLRGWTMFSRTLEVDASGLRLLSSSREERLILWSDVQEVRDDQSLRRLEVRTAQGLTIPVEYQLEQFAEFRQLLREMTGL